MLQRPKSVLNGLPVAYPVINPLPFFQRLETTSQPLLLEALRSARGELLMPSQTASYAESHKQLII